MTLHVDPGMNTKFVYVQHIDPADLSYFWDSVLRILEKGEEYWGRYYESKDIYLEVFSRTMDLLLVGTEDTPYGVILTQVVQYPKVKILRFVYSGSEDSEHRIDEGLTVHYYIICWAKETHGVQWSEAFGRKGWERVLKSSGYEFAGVTMRKDLTKFWRN